jgi:RNA polymerase sigma-54 factor
MTPSANLFLRQTHSLVLTPRLMQAIQLLQMTRFELKQFITLKVEKNPPLEFQSNDGETGDDEKFGRLPEDAGADDRYDNRTGALSSEWHHNGGNASTSRLSDELDAFCTISPNQQARWPCRVSDETCSKDV